MYVHIMKKKDYIKQDLPHKCRWCKNEIDPDICWCGDSYRDHAYVYDHSFVPMGCICGYVSLSDNFNINLNDDNTRK